MASTLNEFTMIGTVVSVPRLRFTNEGKPHVELDLTGPGAPGQTHTVVADGDLARNVNTTLAPGVEVLVVGHLQASTGPCSHVVRATAIGASLGSATAVITPTTPPPTTN